ncbi:MAG: hypothetical protein Q8L22_29220 [Reyranella sp.]|nr:hypothetical protein [Reyranella sp.]
MMKISRTIGLAVALAGPLSACGEQGYSRTESRSARVGSTGPAADAASNNGSLSTAYEKQRQKVNGGAVD